MRSADLLAGTYAMIEATTVSFRDADSGEEATIIVRFDSEHVALCLSLRQNGDIEVVMSKDDARRLSGALQKIL